MVAEYAQVVINKTELLKHIIKEKLYFDVNKVGRQSELIEARFIYFYILREEAKMPYQRIGETVNMNHASILHGCKKAKEWIESDAEFRDKYLRAFASYSGAVYGIEKQQEVEAKIKKLEQEAKKKTDDAIKGIKRPARRTGDAYDRLHILIDKTPEEKAESLLERVEAMYNMMQMDLKRKRI